MTDNGDFNRSIEQSAKRTANWTRVLGICAIIGTPIAIASVFLMLPDRFLPWTEPSVSDALSIGANATEERSARDDNMVDGTPYEQDSTNQSKADDSHREEVLATSLYVKELCERDMKLMGHEDGHDFTESPYCPTDSTPRSRLILSELPHPE